MSMHTRLLDRTPSPEIPAVGSSQTPPVSGQYIDPKKRAESIAKMEKLFCKLIKQADKLDKEYSKTRNESKQLKVSTKLEEVHEKMTNLRTEIILLKGDVPKHFDRFED